MHLALPFWPPLTSWGIATIMIIGSLAISANKRNTSKDKRTVPLSSLVFKRTVPLSLRFRRNGEAVLYGFAIQFGAWGSNYGRHTT